MSQSNMSNDSQTTLACPPAALCLEGNNMCPICLDDFVDLETPPIQLECLHKFCQKCFEEHFSVCVQQRRDVECPICRGLIFKNVLSVIVTVTPQHVVVEQRQDLCFTRTLVLLPFIAMIIVVIIMMVWAGVVKKW